MARNINDMETLIVFEGVPYVLSKQSPNSTQCPCDLCDLRVKCDGGDEAKEFYRLCTPKHLPQCYHFEEDWHVLALHVADFCVNVEDFEEIENTEYLLENENDVIGYLKKTIVQTEKYLAGNTESIDQSFCRGVLSTAKEIWKLLTRKKSKK